ncbi:MAG: hypothetical protein FJ029_15715, partial [Actinobacteria bacterium]|nr:hypothetical protein [Actinomycetota bacterium]
MVPQLPPAIALPARITDVAGTGALGVAGDGGPAAQAQFRSVGGVAVDGAGIIYISDPSASTIRRIQLTGVIELLAGTGVRGARGDGGQARAAELTDPGRMLVDGAGNLYVAEADRVRRIGTDGVVSSILGDGRPGVDGDGGPAAFARTAGNAGMAVDGDGNLFIAERAAHRIRRIDARGLVATAAGTGSPGVAGDGGPAVRAQLDQPVDVEIDGNGNLLIAELGGNRIRVVSPDGIIRTLAGTGRTGYAGDGGPAVSAELSGPQAVVIDGARQIFIADWNNRRIRRVGVDGRIDTIAGSAAGAPESGRVAVETRLALPLELAPTPDGGLLVVEQGTRRLRKLTPGVPTPTPTIAATAPAVTSSYRAPAPSLPFPPAVAAAPIAEIFAGADKAGFEGDGGSRLSAVFNSPRGIAVDGGGQVLVADTGNHRVRQIGLDGGVRTIAGTGAPGFAGDGAIATQAQLNRPAALVVDSAGAVYVADAGNFRIRRIAPDGVISTIAGGSRPGSG